MGPRQASPDLAEPPERRGVRGYDDRVPEPDAHEVLEDVDGDTVPRSRLLAAWGPREPAAPAVAAAPAGPAALAAPTVAPLVVRDAPEPARTAERRTGPDLEHRIAPWAVPAPPVTGSAPDPATAPAPAAAGSRSRTQRHAMYAPPRGAVDLAPERPTPLTDPPRRGLWPWRRSRRAG